MHCGSCASIKRTVSQNCLEISPIPFAVAPEGSITLDNVYQSAGGTVIATGVINVQGTLSPDTDIILTFQKGTTTVATITFDNVTVGSTLGFTVQTPFDNMDITVDNNDATITSIGTLDIVLVVNY